MNPEREPGESSTAPVEQGGAGDESSSAPAPPPAEEGAEPTAGRADPTPSATGKDAEDGADRRARRIVIASVAVLAVAGLLLAFFAGTRLSGPAQPVAAPTPTASPSPTPTPTPTPIPTPTPTVPSGTRPAGTWAWDELGGGECLAEWTSPWAEEFTVVDCAAPHPAQLLARGLLDADPGAAYPGEEAITERLGLTCTDPKVLDPDAAEAYRDLQVQAAYPPNADRWAAGERGWFCFALRSSGDALTGSLAAG